MAETPLPRSSMEKLLEEMPHDSTNEHQYRLRKYQTKSSGEKKTTILLMSSLSLNILILILLIASFFFHFEKANSTKDVTNDMTYWTSFSEDLNYQSLDPRYDAEWNKLSVNTTGIIQDSDGRLGGIAMFHQLHCIAMLRKALQDSIAGKNIGFDHHDGGHWPHCLDYMRKSTLCYADGTVEKTDVDIAHITNTEEPINLDISGQDPRWCKNAAVLYERRESQKFVL